MVGGLGGGSTYSGYDYDANRAYCTHSGNSTSSAEYFKGEGYRLSHSTINSWGSETSNSVAVWSAKGVYQNDNLPTTDQHLVQVNHTGSTYKLVHPSKVTGTLANSPTQDWSNPGNGTYTYYRWFYTSSSTSNIGLTINGLTKANYISQYNNISIKVSRAGVDSSFIPLLVTSGSGVGYDNNDQDASCWYDPDGMSSNSMGYNLTFNSDSSKIFILEITMNENFNQNITSIIFNTGIQPIN